MDDVERWAIPSVDAEAFVGSVPLSRHYWVACATFIIAVGGVVSGVVQNALTLGDPLVWMLGPFLITLGIVIGIPSLQRMVIDATTLRVSGVLGVERSSWRRSEISGSTGAGRQSRKRSHA
ncbi:MAG: hypothetical protein AAGI53_10650 [Planctomycetota bacterium]